MRISDIRISAKIIGAILFVGVIGFAAVILSTIELRKVDATYSELLDQRSRAILETARAGRAANDLLAQAYKVIAYPGGSKGEQEGRVQAQSSYLAAQGYLKNSATLIPSFSQSYAVISKKISDLKLGVDEAIVLGARDENEKALHVMDTVDAELVDIIKSLVSLNEEIFKNTSIASNDLTTASNTTIIMVIAGSLLGTLLGTLIAWWMSSKTITGPLARLQNSMGRLAEADFDVAVDGVERRDEVGQMAKAVLVFKQNGLEMQRLELAAAENDKLSQAERLRNEQERQRVEAEKALAAEQQAQIVGLIDAGLDRLAQGDLTFRIVDEVGDSYLTLRDNFNAAVVRLSETIATMQSTSSEVANAAHEINSGADDLSKRTEEQASSLEETAATTEELAASVKASAQNARQAASIASQALAAAEGGGVIAGQAVEAMARIESASQKISDIIRVIDDIAFQTNLLALNAAVEAARAGDAGKGFAVVASEVRTLAQRSGEAAKDISALISSSNGEVGEGVKLVRQAGEALTNIRDASHKVAATIAEISAASGEQANGIDEMSQAVAHLDEMTQANAALAEQSAASASALTQRIGQLDQLVATFKIDRGEAVIQPKTLGFVQKVGQALAIVTPHLRAQTPARKRASNGNSGWSEF